jgi:hypothetical protein
MITFHPLLPLAYLSLAIAAATAAPDEKTTRSERAKFLEKAAAKTSDTTTAPVPAPNPTGDVPGQIVGDFFGFLEKGRIEEAYANLTKGSKTIQTAEDLRILKQKTKEAIESFGAVQGYELVETKMVGNKLMRRTYLSLGSEFPLRWRFYFYNASNRWRLIDLRVDDRLVGMFDEPKDTADDRNTGKP